MGLFRRSTPETETVKVLLEAQSERVTEVLREARELEREINRALQEVGERLAGQEKTIRLMAEEMEERIDRGNKIWRKIRASEYYEKQREEGEDDGQAFLDFHPGNGGGGEAEELPPLHPALAHRRHAATKAREVGRAIARRQAGLD